MLATQKARTMNGDILGVTLLNLRADVLVDRASYALTASALSFRETAWTTVSSAAAGLHQFGVLTSGRLAVRREYCPRPILRQLFARRLGLPAGSNILAYRSSRSQKLAGSAALGDSLPLIQAR